VYRVKERTWGKTMAVKIFRETEGGKMFPENETSDAWRRDMNALTLQRDTIVRMFYVVYRNSEDKRELRRPLGYVMELMACSAADRSNYSLQQLLNVFVQIADALQFAHEQGIIHFDVKPENILLDEDCRVAKLCDFGCAHKLQTAAASVSESVIEGELFRGTKGYMAPEVFRGELARSKNSLSATEVADLKGDEQSLGIDLVEGSRQSAFELCDIFSFGKTMWQLLHPSLKVEINRTPSVSAAVPRELADLVEQCMLDDASMRPRSMSEVLKRLQSVQEKLESLPVS
jgi:serine/threonine protein kinase